MTSPPVAALVGEALTRYPEPVRARLLEIREVIFTVAAGTEGVGTLTETLKWGEPAYLTEASGSGTTIRIGTTKTAPRDCAVLFNCRTSLIGTLRTRFAEDFAFEGNRALIVPVAGPLPHEPLAFCIRAALTYHRRASGPYHR